MRVVGLAEEFDRPYLYNYQPFDQQIENVSPDFNAFVIDKKLLLTFILPVATIEFDPNIAKHPHISKRMVEMR